MDKNQKAILFGQQGFCLSNIFPNRNAKIFQETLILNEMGVIKTSIKLWSYTAILGSVSFLLIYGSIALFAINKPALALICWIVFAIISFCGFWSKIDKMDEELQKSDTYRSVYKKAEKYVTNCWV